jgi:hypothetical protein
MRATPPSTNIWQAPHYAPSFSLNFLPLTSSCSPQHAILGYLSLDLPLLLQQNLCLLTF